MSASPRSGPVMFGARNLLDHSEDTSMKPPFDEVSVHQHRRVLNEKASSERDREDQDDTNQQRSPSRYTALDGYFYDFDFQLRYQNIFHTDHNYHILSICNDDLGNSSSCTNHRTHLDRREIHIFTPVIIFGVRTTMWRHGNYLERHIGRLIWKGNNKNETNDRDILLRKRKKIEW